MKPINNLRFVAVSLFSIGISGFAIAHGGPVKVMGQPVTL